VNALTDSCFVAPRLRSYALRIQNDLKILTERLSRINDSLARKVQSAPTRPSPLSCTCCRWLPVTNTTRRSRRPRLLTSRKVPSICMIHARRCFLQRSGCVWWQILESSQTLLHVLKRESANMNKKKQASS